MNQEITPQRIQRKRVKGFDMQQVSKELNGLECVSVCRPHKWGNPFKIGEPIGDDSHFISEGVNYIVKDAKDAVRLFKNKHWMMQRFDAIDYSELKGKNLACFCPLDSPCHADALLEYANQ